ncbi:uncharacterized protein BXZ73DRAFT_79082 [Epithele typhae]|uniref:uncharacterized protein n=1 Tax=Epithele typhae TaxID=378194 RepID=UPI002008E886|nr:uncharacterized protein BXZ73DRAFT_79082 [Epithele typhae]KAH9925433.1 hypothetical protein BXZ73DRAFT_79082 [Epithele typhae]
MSEQGDWEIFSGGYDAYICELQELISSEKMETLTKARSDNLSKKDAFLRELTSNQYHQEQKGKLSLEQRRQARTPPGAKLPPADIDPKTAEEEYGFGWYLVPQTLHKRMWLTALYYESHRSDLPPPNGPRGLFSADDLRRSIQGMMAMFVTPSPAGTFTCVGEDLEPLPPRSWQGIVAYGFFDPKNKYRIVESATQADIDLMTKFYDMEPRWIMLSKSGGKSMVEEVYQEPEPIGRLVPYEDPEDDDEKRRRRRRCRREEDEEDEETEGNEI